VRAVAAQLGYVPNQFARRLRSGKSRLIGLLVAEVYTPFMAEIIAGVESEIVEQGYNVLVFSTFRDIEIEKRVVQSVCELMVEGIIVAACEEENPLLRQLCENRFPLVYLDSRPPLPDCAYVMNDMEAVARLGMEYLLRLGHRRILLVNGEERIKSFSAFAALENEYRAALQESGVAPDDALIRYHGITLRDGYDAVQSALEEGVEFSAVFAVSDHVALGVIECLEAHGKKVPDDVSVLGIDNSEISGLSRIGLSTIETYHKTSGKEDMGTLAAHSLLEMIGQEGSTPAPPIILKPRLVRRHSCRTFRATRTKTA
jgi:LacI family transcriptional regulator